MFAKPAVDYGMLQKKERTLQAFNKIFILSLMDCCSFNYVVFVIPAVRGAVWTPDHRKSWQEEESSTLSMSQS